MKHLYLLTAMICLGLMGCATTVPLKSFHEVRQPDGTVRDEAVVNGRVYYVPPGHKVCNLPDHCRAPQYCGFIGVNTLPVCKQ